MECVRKSQPMMSGHHSSRIRIPVLGKNTRGHLDLVSKSQPMMTGHHTCRNHTAVLGKNTLGDYNLVENHNL
jgi:hypothetical protein